MGKIYADVNFDEKYDRLKNAVYNTPKGMIRELLLKEDISEFIPRLSENGPLTILDAGCGTGMISRWIAREGFDITRIDISKKMLADAGNLDEEQIPGINVKNICQSVQQHAADGKIKYDVIICHGMLAWLADPHEGFGALDSLLKPGGMMSLLYYNRNRNILRNGLLGNFYCLRTGDYRPRQKGGGLTPINPLREKEVLAWIREKGLRIVSKSGIRIFYGLANNHNEFAGKEQALLDTERLFYRQEPFASVGVHTHMVLSK